MNYEQMSDFEINKEVAAWIYADAIEFTGDKSECSVWQLHEIDTDELVIVAIVDYCNNPSDAWPIITKNIIGLTPSIGGDIWEADRHYSYRHENPLRAAMIVYLMMQE